MKKILAAILAFTLLSSLLVSCNSAKVSAEETNFVMITVKDYGEIIVELYPDVAPITVKNFKKLVSEGFYDGLIFHRIIEGFMIQGGGFTESYKSKDSASIKGEFAANGVENDLKHTRGVISMARTNDMNSASSQFFICQETYEYGDGNYAAFGKVVEGIKVVDKIAAVATGYGDRPLSNVVIESIKFVTYEG